MKGGKKGGKKSPLLKGRVSIKAIPVFILGQNGTTGEHSTTEGYFQALFFAWGRFPWSLCQPRLYKVVNL